MFSANMKIGELAVAILLHSLVCSIRILLSLAQLVDREREQHERKVRSRDNRRKNMHRRGLERQ